jgi:hypothetical protein
VIFQETVCIIPLSVQSIKSESSKKMKMKYITLSFLFIALGFVSCEKDPGTGGTSTIEGKIWVLDYNSEYTHLNAQYYGSKEDVYLLYGGDDVYSESFKTSFDGSYRFEHLRKGKYRVFCYSEDTTGLIPGGKFAVMKDVEITSNKQTVTAEDMKIVK